VSGSVWCELAWLGGERPAAGVLIELEGERIASVVAAEPPPGARVLRGLTLPGLANAHSHAFQRALRGRTEQPAGGSFWSWRERMYELAAALDDDALEALSRAAFAEMALAGITLVGEFDYLHRSRALIRAAEAAGIRLTLIDACYLHGGLQRFHDADAHAWCERVAALPAAGARLRLAAAIHSVRAVDPRAAAIVAGFAAERGWPLHAHVSEQPAENEQCLARHGATPLALLEGAGALSERFTAVHATHLSEADAARLADAGAFCCMCPTTERDLADGIGAVHGRLTLGSDSQSFIDLFEEARAVELDERLRSGVRGRHGAAELARAATEHGYRSLGWPEGGRIEPGALADLTTVSLESVRLAGTRAQDALDAVIFAAGAADVRDVIVGGREVVRDGRHVRLDVPAELSAAIAAAWR
jgi:formiminoglutamate deiminase